MIRINLLGTPKKKSKKRLSLNMPVIPAEGPSIYVIALVVFTIGVGGNFLHYRQLSSTHEKLMAEIQESNQQAQQLAFIKQKFMQRQKEADEIKRRFDVIEQLRNNQATPVRLLSLVSEGVNTSDTVWLTSMNDQGANVKMEGYALSHVAVANFMTNLRKTDGFKNVELEETVQQDYKGVPAFTFKLTVEKSGDKFDLKQMAPLGENAKQVAPAGEKPKA
ncbi:MAG TPA: PilN domain-containing protein [candidate division Zixibacteria bacterium]|nr:PilN domain-containing protein [candidate division Zixibacteria bacterium]